MTINLALLHPDLLPLVGDCLNKFPNMRIVQGFREPAFQDSLHARGISPLTSMTSKHCFMLDGKPASKAFDFAVFDGPTYITNGADERYTEIGKYAEELGLCWGGGFIHPGPDYDHIEMIG